MTERFVFDSFGVVVSVAVEANDRHLAEVVEAILPPGRVDLRPITRPSASFAITGLGGRYSVYGPEPRTDRVDWDDEVEAVHDLDRRIRAVVSLHAPDHVFIHAGVVAGAWGALVLPGRSFAGKTTLVGALLSAGASYLSDEYAVLDADGTVWPYPRPLSFRTKDGRADVPARMLGRTAGSAALPVALVISTSYQAGGRWEAQVGTAAECALALIDNAVAARTRSEAVMAVTAAVARKAMFLEGERGAAEEIATDLLRLVGGPLHRHPVAASGSRPAAPL